MSIEQELDYRLIKELWAFHGNRIAVRFAYESHDDSGNWFRSYGNENWEFDAHGLMRLRIASINDLAKECFDFIRQITRAGPDYVVEAAESLCNREISVPGLQLAGCSCGRIGRLIERRAKCKERLKRQVVTYGRDGLEFDFPYLVKPIRVRFDDSFVRIAQKLLNLAFKVGEVLACAPEPTFGIVKGIGSREDHGPTESLMAQSAL
jgi:Protein of unknown function (DUF1348)